jgi:hypothetical protein
VGIDEWSEFPFAMEDDGELHFVDVTGDRGIVRKTLPFVAQNGIGSVHYNQLAQRLTVGTNDGQFTLVDINYKPVYQPDGSRIIDADPKAGPLLAVGRPGVPVTSIAYADAGARKLVVAAQTVEDRTELHAVTLSQRRSLVGGGRTTVDKTFDLTPLIEGEISRICSSTTDVRQAASTTAIWSSRPEPPSDDAGGRRFRRWQSSTTSSASKGRYLSDSKRIAWRSSESDICSIVM